MEVVVQDYFNKMFSNPKGSNMGRLEDADVIMEERVCEKEGRDQLSLYIRMESERVKEIRFMCTYCDPYMFVAADILSRLFKGKELEGINRIGEKEFYKALGGRSEEALKHFNKARELFLRRVSK